MGQFSDMDRISTLPCVLRPGLLCAAFCLLCTGRRERLRHMKGAVPPFSPAIRWDPGLRTTPAGAVTACFVVTWLGKGDNGVIVSPRRNFASQFQPVSQPQQHATKQLLPSNMFPNMTPVLVVAALAAVVVALPSPAAETSPAESPLRTLGREPECK